MDVNARTSRALHPIRPTLTPVTERLHTVQSNETARIQKLEEALGTSLLKRHARGINLTPAGEAAFKLALGRGAKLRTGAIETSWPRNYRRESAFD